MGVGQVLWALTEEDFLAHMPTEQEPAQSAPHEPGVPVLGVEPHPQESFHVPIQPQKPVRALNAQALQQRVIQREQKNNKALHQARSMLVKNGWFLGAEIAISGTDLKQDLSRFDGASDSLVLYQGKAKRANFNMGVVAGYQHYFGNTQKHGIKASAHLYGGTSSVLTYSPITKVRGF
ncbi:unknown [Helicobacter bizzozeronii CCUG 35545]|nr:unknown [Helicobacter bizzozeronii CCUG 35545]